LICVNSLPSHAFRQATFRSWTLSTSYSSCARSHDQRATPQVADPANEAEGDERHDHRRARALEQATSVIPIVFATAGDPVGNNLVASLARPGGNATGLSILSADLAGKRLELAPVQSVTRPAARQHPRPDAENFGGEVSF